MSDSGERRESSKLWLIEHVVELRRATAERARGAVRTIVPEQLKERVVGDIRTTKSFRSNETVSSLGWRQRSVFKPLRHEPEQGIEEREARTGVGWGLVRVW